MHCFSEVSFLDTNNEMIGYVSRRFGDIIQCNNLNDSSKILSLLGSLVSLMIEQESKKLSATIFYRDENINIEFACKIEPIGVIKSDLDIFNGKSDQLNKCRDYYSDIEIGKYTKTLISKRMLKTKSRDLYNRDIFSGLFFYINKGILAPSFKIKIPCSGHIFELTVRVKSHTLQ